MIGSSTLGCSSFGADPLIGDSFDVFDIDQFEVEIASLQRNESSCSTSPVHSSSSDDCDWSSFSDILPIAETLASELLEKEESLIDSLGLNDNDWVALTDTFIDEEPTNERVSDAHETPRKKLKSTTKSSPNPPSLKPWSRMSDDERLRTAHGLSEIVSRRMDLVHQIEVIKLIDPSAVLSPNTTEFTINLFSLNDEKIKRIQEHIEKYAVCKRNPDTTSTEKKNNKSCRSYSSSSSSETNCFTKRKQRKYNKASANSNHIRVSELKYRQRGKKEKQSSFFVQEKVIKKLSDPTEEDEDVNILD